MKNGSVQNVILKGQMKSFKKYGDNIGRVDVGKKEYKYEQTNIYETCIKLKTAKNMQFGDYNHFWTEITNKKIILWGEWVTQDA